MCKVLKIKKAIEGMKAVLTEDQWNSFVIPLLKNVSLTLTVEDWLDVEVTKSDKSEKMRKLAKKRWNKTCDSDAEEVCESDAKKVCEANAKEANKINASQDINLCEGLCDTHAESDAVKEMRDEIKKLKEERDQLAQTVTLLKQRDQQLLKEKMELMELQNRHQEPSNDPTPAPSPAPVEEKPNEEEVKHVLVSNSTKMKKEDSERYLEEFTKRSMEFNTKGTTVEELKQFIKELDDFYLKAADNSLCGEVNFLKMDAKLQLMELEKATTAVQKEDKKEQEEYIEPTSVHTEKDLMSVAESVVTKPVVQTVLPQASYSELQAQFNKLEAAAEEVMATNDPFTIKSFRTKVDNWYKNAGVGAVEFIGDVNFLTQQLMIKLTEIAEKEKNNG